MAAESNLKNMVLSLSLVCLVCSALLGGAYAMTKAPIETAQAAKISESISRVLPGVESEPELCTVEVGGVEYTYYNVPGSGIAVISKTSGFGGPLSLMVGISADGLITGTAVLSHSETPGLGAKCTSDEPFIAQFRGFDPERQKLAVRKDGGDVDAITASTITSRAYTSAVAAAYDVYLNLKANE